MGEIYHTWNHWGDLANRVIEFASILNGTANYAYKYTESPGPSTSGKDRSYKKEMLEHSQLIELK